MEKFNENIASWSEEALALNLKPTEVKTSEINEQKLSNELKQVLKQKLSLTTTGALEIKPKSSEDKSNQKAWKGKSIPQIKRKKNY